MPTLRLIYFDAPGRAESVRTVFRLGGVSFEDVRLSYAEFGQQRANGAFPLGSVPVLEVDGVPMVQTAAMLRYAARIGATDLYPDDAWDAFVVDSALDCINDTLTNALMPSMVERDPEAKMRLRQAFVEVPLPRVLGHIESLLGRSDGPFLLGEQLTIADIVLALQVGAMLRGVLDGITADHLAPFPRLCAHAAAYAAHPRIAALG
jgi:glutathione S-transferase